MELTDITSKLARVTALAGMIRRTLRTLLIVDVVAALALIAGFWLLGLRGGWTVLAVLVGAAALIPGFFVWVGTGLFKQVEELPQTMTDLGALPERATTEVRDVLATAASPKGVRGAIWESRGLLRELMEVLPIVDFIKSVRVLTLGTTAAAAGAIPLIAVVAAGVLVAGIVL